MRHPPQEADVLPGRTVLGVGVGVVASIIIGVLIVTWVGRCQARAVGGAWVPPVARPEITGDIDIMRTRPFAAEAQGLDRRAREQAWLEGYGWTDQAHGIIRVPIEVGMDLYLDQQQGGRP